MTFSLPRALHGVTTGLAAALLLTGLFVPDGQAQRLYGIDGGAGAVYEFSALPGGPCGAPIPFGAFWPYAVPAPCAFPPPPPGPFPPAPGGFMGDIAANRLTDTVFATDGFVIEEYAEFSPITGVAPGTPINAFPVPPIGTPFGIMGPLTGMGMDPLGAVTGAPTLWVTDGAFIAGIGPSAPGSCAPAPVLFPAFPSPFPLPVGAILTDVTWDPSTASLLACDSIGTVHSIVPGGGAGPFAIFPVAGAAGCGLAPGLQGIAMDLATTPSALGTLPAFYVTDGFVMTYLDVTGAPAAPTFYTPVMCNGTPGPINGLAYNSHGNNYGAAPGAATAGTFGQSSSPGPTFGLFLAGAPMPSFVWVAYGVNVPGPGFFCPPLIAVGNPLYTDPFTPPGGLIPLAAAIAPLMPIPAPIPGGLPAGVEVYVQFFMDLTPAAPGGPWLSTDAVNFTITTP